MLDKYVELRKLLPTEEQYNDWYFRYNGIDDINNYYYLKKGDSAWFCNKQRVVKNDSRYNTLYIEVKLNTGCLRKLSISDMIFEYKNDIILKNNRITEEEYSNWNFRYHKVKINNYIDAKAGDYVLFCKKLKRVILDKRTNILFVRISTINNKEYRISINDMIMEYKQGFILNYKSLTEATYNNWEYRYQNVNSINEYLNRQPGDEILFCGNYYKLGIFYHKSTDDKYKLVIQFKVDGKNTSQFLHRLIYEYYNKTIIPEGYIIHHIDCNPFNNNPDNLIMLTKSEHLKVHSVDWSRKIININNGEIFNSITEAGNYYKVDMSTISASIRQNSITYINGIKTKFKYYEEYLSINDNCFDYEEYSDFIKFNINEYSEYIEIDGIEYII